MNYSPNDDVVPVLVRNNVSSWLEPWWACKTNTGQQFLGYLSKNTCASFFAHTSFASADHLNSKVHTPQFNILTHNYWIAWVHEEKVFGTTVKIQYQSQYWGQCTCRPLVPQQVKNAMKKSPWPHSIYPHHTPHASIHTPDQVALPPYTHIV